MVGTLYRPTSKYKPTPEYTQGWAYFEGYTGLYSVMEGETYNINLYKCIIQVLE